MTPDDIAKLRQKVRERYEGLARANPNAAYVFLEIDLRYFDNCLTTVERYAAHLGLLEESDGTK